MVKNKKKNKRGKYQSGVSEGKSIKVKKTYITKFSEVDGISHHRFQQVIVWLPLSRVCSIVPAPHGWSKPDAF